MRIGVYVGSFNPFHKGHKHVVDFLLDNDYIDKIIIIPTGNYWNKINLISTKDRVDMIKKYSSDKIIIEENINNLPYTYQVLDKLKEIYPKDTLYLIIGSDNLVNFHLWKNIDSILENKVIVLSRGEINMQEYINKFENSNNFIIANNFIKIDISSTEIRNMIKEKNYQDLSKYLDDNIIKYISENNLYS